MKETTDTKQPQTLGDELRQPYDGRQIERRLLHWLHNYYLSLTAARPFDDLLSRKLDCVNFLIESNRTRYAKKDNTPQSSAGLHENGI